MDQIFYRKNQRGLIEAVDMTTNKVVAVQHTLTQAPSMTKIILPDGTTALIEDTLVVKGDALNAYLPDRSYSKIHADLIIQLIVEGFTLKKACKELEIEYTVVNRWKTEHTEFRDRLDEAYKDRTEWQHDEIIEVAQGSHDPKIKIEALKWSAGANNPEKFSPKTKISGDKNAPVQFVLATGIDRGPEPPTEEKVVGPAHAAGEALPPATLNYSTEATEEKV